MPRRSIYDRDGHAHFVTFSCYKRRRLLDCNESRQIVLAALNAQLQRLAGLCIGFVLMPNHVHAILWFAVAGQSSEAMKQWKRMSSYRIKTGFSSFMSKYAQRIDAADPIWQPKYYDFNLFSDAKVEEKLTYMHQNPVRAGLVATAADWPWSSARWYEEQQLVGIPIGWPE